MASENTLINHINSKFYCVVLIILGHCLYVVLFILKENTTQQFELVDYVYHVHYEMLLYIRMVSVW